MAEQYGRPDGRNRFQIRSAALGTLPAAWLDEEFNKVYSSLNSITVQAVANVSEWTVVTDTFSYLSPNSFIVPANYTAIFEELRAVKLKDNVGNTYTSHVQSSIYNAGTGTTITLIDSVVPETIEEVSVGLMSEESSPLPSTKITNIDTSSSYTPSADDSVLLVNDANGTNVIWDDGEKTDTPTGGGKTSLQIILPFPSTMNRKMLHIKKVGGNNQIVIASSFTHSYTYQDQKYVHTNTYPFQVFPQGIAKNRIVLKGIGDYAILVSNGENWFEITPRSTEKVEGLVRLATEEEITLTQEQKDKGEELSKELAVSPYNLDKTYSRSNAANSRSSSNFIYEQRLEAYLAEGVIYIPAGLSLSIPDGRDDKGVAKNEIFETKTQLTFSSAESSDKNKLLFVNKDNVMREVLLKNYYVSYFKPKMTSTTTTGDIIMWYDLQENYLKISTDNGTNYTNFHGAGPICRYYGNGNLITSLFAYKPVLNLTAGNLEALRKSFVDDFTPNYSAGFSISSPYTTVTDGWVYAYSGSGDWQNVSLTIDGTLYLNTGRKSYNTATCMSAFVPKGKEITFSASGGVCRFIPCQYDLK